MVDDTSVSVDHYRLRDRALAVHQRARRLSVGPAKAEAETDIVQKFIHTARGSTRVFRGQSYELHLASCISLTYSLILRNFSTARTAPGGPEVYHYDFAVEVREAEAATFDALNLPLAETLRKENQRRGRGGWPELGFRIEWWLNGCRLRGPRCADSSSRLRSSAQRTGSGDEE